MSRLRVFVVLETTFVVACLHGINLRADEAPAAQPAGGITWQSAATGGAIRGTLMTPPAGKEPKAGLATVVYLKNLSIPRLGQEEDGPIIADSVKDGDLVLVLDYA